MVLFLTNALVACAGFLGQSGDASGSPESAPVPASGWPLPELVDPTEETKSRIAAPSLLWWESLPGSPFRLAAPTPSVRATLQESFDVASGKNRTSVGFGPTVYLVDRLSLGAEFQGSEARPGGRIYRTDGGLLPLDPAAVRVGVRWQDRNHELAASIGSQYNAAAPAQSKHNIAFSIKATLPEPLASWYVQSQLSAASDASLQTDLALGTERDVRGAGRWISNFGVSHQEFLNAAPPQANSSAVNWSVQWRLNDRLSFRTSIHYYFDVHNVESLMSLELKSGTPGAAHRFDLGH